MPRVLFVCAAACLIAIEFALSAVSWMGAVPLLEVPPLAGLAIEQPRAEVLADDHADHAVIVLRRRERVGPLQDGGHMQRKALAGLDEASRTS